MFAGMKDYFNFKDKIKRELRSSLVYNFNCNNCNTAYINDIIEREFLEHIVFFPLIEKCVKNNSQTSAAHDHMLLCKIIVCPEDFPILAKSSYNFKLH